MKESNMTQATDAAIAEAIDRALAAAPELSDAQCESLAARLRAVDER